MRKGCEIAMNGLKFTYETILGEESLTRLDDICTQVMRIRSKEKTIYRSGFVAVMRHKGGLMKIVQSDTNVKLTQTNCPIEL